MTNSFRYKLANPQALSNYNPDAILKNKNIRPVAQKVDSHPFGIRLLSKEKLETKESNFKTRGKYSIFPKIVIGYKNSNNSVTRAL